MRPRSVPAYLWLLLASLAAVLLWSGIGPKERGTWWLEVAPVLIGVPILAATYRRFPLTPLTYVLIWIHAVILIVGGHYTYAEVPLFDWIRDVLGLSRNHYDRVGHLAQGFVPAILAREVLLRTSPLRPGGGCSSWCAACASPSAHCTN
jgi:putative membrane protein